MFLLRVFLVLCCLNSLVCLYAGDLKTGLEEGLFLQEEIPTLPWGGKPGKSIFDSSPGLGSVLDDEEESGFLDLEDLTFEEALDKGLPGLQQQYAKEVGFGKAQKKLLALAQESKEARRVFMLEETLDEQTVLATAGGRGDSELVVAILQYGWPSGFNRRSGNAWLEFCLGVDPTLEDKPENERWRQSVLKLQERLLGLHR